MKSISLKHNKTVYLSLAAVAASCIAYICIAKGLGSSLVAVPLVFLACFSFIYLPGCVLRRLFNIEGEANKSVAIALGTGVFTVASVLAAFTQVYFIPIIVGVAFVAIGIIKYKKDIRLPSQRPVTAIVFALLLIGVVFASALPFAHPTVQGTVPAQDFYWNLGNAQSFLIGLPPPDLRLAGESLTYHYLTELVVAGIHMCTNVPMHDIMAFALTPVIVFTILLVAQECIVAVFRKCALRNFVFIGSLFLFGCAGLYTVYQREASSFGNSFVLHILSNINSVGTCVLFLCCFSAILATLINASFKSYGLYIAGLCAFAFVTLSKGPIAVIIVIALVMTAVLRQKHEGNKLRFLIFSIACALVFGLFYLVLFQSGAASSVVFSLDGTLNRFYFQNYLHIIKATAPSIYPFALPAFYALQAFLMSPFITMFFVIGLIKQIILFFKGKSNSLSIFFALCTCGGFLAFFIFDLGGLSQIYFAFVALFFASLLASDTVAQLAEKHKQSKTALTTAVICMGALLLCISVATGVINYAVMIKSGVASVNTPQSTTKLLVTQDMETALLQLNKISNKSQIFATNRIHSSSALENNSNVFTGISGRVSFAEGLRYSISNMNSSIEEIIYRQNIVKKIFANDATPESAALHAKAHNISYLVYDKTAILYDCNEGTAQNTFYLRPLQNNMFIEQVFENSDIIIYKVK